MNRLTTVKGFPVEMPPKVSAGQDLYEFYRMRTSKPLLVRYVNLVYDDYGRGANGSIRIYLRNETRDYFIVSPTNQYLIANSRRNYTREPMLLDMSPGILFAPGDEWVIGSDNQSSYWYYFTVALYGEEYF